MYLREPAFVNRNYLKTLYSCDIIFPKVDFLKFWICCSPLNSAQNDTKYHFSLDTYPILLSTTALHVCCA